MSKFKYLALSAIAAASLGSVPASALVTFASFSPASSADNVRFTNGAFFTALNGTGGPSSVDVLFNFLVGGSSAPQGVSASYTLNAVVPDTGLPASGSFTLDNVSGSFSFLSNEAITVGTTVFAAGSNLLSGSFGNTFFDGTVGGTSGAMRGSTDGGAVISYTSDFVTFSAASVYDFSLALTAVEPPFGPAAGPLQDFNASMGGQFSSEPAPFFGVVPEPSTWAMLVLGFGLVGVRARRRKPVTVSV